MQEKNIENMAHKNAMPWLFLSQLLFQILCAHAKLPAIIVFGDSSVDAGNNNHITTPLKSNFLPYGRDFIGGKPTGRFCNGRMATEFISEAFGIKPTIPAYLDPTYGIRDFATGVCFASAGTGFDNATSDVMSVIPLWKEMAYYKQYQRRLRGHLGKTKADRILQEALYILSLGTNDFLENYYVAPRRSLEYSEEEYQNFLIGIARNFIMELYQLGARKMSITGLLPMGCLPLERTTNIIRGSGCVEKYNLVARNFNEKMKGLIKKLNMELEGVQMVYTDVYGIFGEIIQNPQAFGYENSEAACCGTGRYEMSYICNRYSPFTCKDANKYVFWDAFHPTEKTNKIVADNALNTSLAIFG